MVGETDLSKLLASLAPHLMDGDFVFCTVQDAKCGDFAELSPLASFREAEGLTLLVAKENADKTRSILDLREQTLHRISDLTGSKATVDAVDFLFRRPIFSGSDFAANSAMTKDIAKRILATMRKADLLITLRPARGRQSAIFGFRDLLNICEGKNVF